MTGELSRGPTIASVFARPGIPGYIFLEGVLPDVDAAIKDLVTVNKARPRLVPPEHQTALLTPHNPMSRPFRDGDWVRCRHGTYRNDIGIVCGHVPSSDVEVVVAFIPRLKEKTTVPAKRKRVSWPEPRRWSACQVEARWGKSQVRRTSDDEYEFGGDVYKSGLVMKRLSPASLEVASAPNDISEFARASCIVKSPFFGSMTRQSVQESIKVGQRVRVISGEQEGWVGHPVDITDGIAALVRNTDDNTPLLQTPLTCLLPAYRPGDHVKFWWGDSHGIVMSVDETNGKVSFVERDTHREVSDNPRCVD